MKRCTYCKEEKVLADFYTCKRSSDGLKSQCKKCHTLISMRTRDMNLKREANASYMARARKLSPEKFRMRERDAARRRLKCEKVIARMAVHAAIRSGELIKMNACESCGECKKLNAHHTDYSKPLDVIWLCTGCHGKEHRK